MGTAHRRILKASDPRCAPHPDCPIKDSCARFTVGMPQGLGATMDNFRRHVITAPMLPYLCNNFLSSMVSDDDLAAEAAAKKIHPPIGSKK